MRTKEDEERIKSLKSDLEEYEKSKSEGRPSISFDLARLRQEELHVLTTTPEQRIADAKAHPRRFGDPRPDPRIHAENQIAAEKFSEQDKRAIAEGKTTADDVYKRNMAAIRAADPNSQENVDRAMGNYMKKHPSTGVAYRAPTGKPKSPLDSGSGSQSSLESHADFSGDIPKIVDPLAPHADFSGDIPKIVNPRKPGPSGRGPA